MINFYVRQIVKYGKSLDIVPASKLNAVKTAVIAYYIGEIESGSITIDDVPNSPDTWQDWVREAMD